MPRQARLDASGVLHRGMVRGIERRRLVPDDTDRADVSGRLAALESVTQAIDGKLATLKAPGYDPTIMPYA